MKIIALITALALSAFHYSDPGVYDYTIITADSATHYLSEYQGKKMMIVILPATQTPEDSLYLLRIDSISQAQQAQLTIIGIPSYEDGYADDSVHTLLNWYASIIDSEVVITQGMFTHQSSDSLQNPLFTWLTHWEQNNHFEQEVGGPGEAYFINEQGELYGVFAPEAKWSDKVLNDMLTLTTQ
jgi:glutathione peroxidase-family protein